MKLHWEMVLSVVNRYHSLISVWRSDCVVGRVILWKWPHSPRNTGKLQNLTEISWFAWVLWLVLCCAVWWQVKSPLKKCLNFDVLSRQIGKEPRQVTSSSWQVTVWQHFPWIIPRLVIHMKHSHTCLAKTSSFVFSQQTKISCRSSWKLAITEDYR